ncbi:MAG: DUF1926 domain-containing protein [Treponema sp.]|nr:DUF1926 domain-containing protein [Treponema sp.]
MKVLHICMAVTAGSLGTTPAALEEAYQRSYKKIISFLSANPAFRLSLSFFGPTFTWLAKKHPECVTLLKELLHRKQIEMLGGGYYNPLFPLLLPLDRSGQIERYTAELTGALGRRPRGMTVYGSVWDNGIVPNLHTCGMEYVLLDASLIAPEKRTGVPLLVTEQGKSITVFPVFRTDVLPDQSVSPASYLAALKHEAESSFGNTEFPVLTLTCDAETFAARCEDGWMSALQETLQASAESVVLTTAQEYRRRHTAVRPAYIAAGVQADIAQWGIVPYTPHQRPSGYPVTIYDFLEAYPRNHALYNRVLYVSTLIANYRADKMRKKSAREKLWQAQTGEAFVCNPQGIFATNAIRQNAYRALTEAEKILREGLPSFSGCVTSYDYDADGNAEYICQMPSFDACISLKGASITELDIMHNTGNYADNLKRIGQFDRVSDTYERGLFVDHLFSPEEYRAYQQGQPTGSGIFSRVVFAQAGFNRRRREIRLVGTDEFGALSQPVTLRKQYVINDNGFTVQYILKNESPHALKARFVVESNFAQTDFSRADSNKYAVAVISGGEKGDLDAQKTPGSSPDVSFLQITDTANDISFVYEPNEDASVTCMPLFFRRPGADGAMHVAGTTFVAALSWDVELAAGGEMEKSVAFTVIIPKKRKKRKPDNIA